MSAIQTLPYRTETKLEKRVSHTESPLNVQYSGIQPRRNAVTVIL